MKISKILIVTLLMTLCCALAANAQVTPTKTITMYWNKLCGYNPASDDVRRMAVSLDGQTIITLNKGINKAQIWHGRSGVIWNKMAESGPQGPDSLDMTGVSGGTFAISDGGFTEDGAFIACNLFTATTHNLKVYIWDTVTTGPRVIYDAIPAPSPRNGDGLAVIGKLSDNTAKVIVIGNNAASRPVVLTTADNGRTWTPTILANPVLAQTVQFDSTGAFWCTRYAAGSPFQKYNPDGSIAGETPPNRIPHSYSFGGLYLDEANGLMYGAGIRENNPVRVFDVATGALIASSTEPILLGGFTTSGGTANGSACVKGLPDGTILVGSERNGIARMRLVNQVIVNDTVNTGDKTTGTIQSVITAYNVGGPLEAYTPLMIAVDPTVTFDESIDLNNGAAWNGKIAGDLLIKSAVPGTNAVIKLRKTPSGNDAIWIAQETNNIMFKDLVLCPSLTDPMGVSSALIRLDQNTVEPFLNWVELYNVIQTNVTTTGDPMVTSKAEAIAAGMTLPPASATVMGLSSFFISHYTDANESMCMLLDNCLAYAATGDAWRVYPNGVSGESWIVNNSLVLWTNPTVPAGYQGCAFRIKSTSPAGATKYLTITGDDAGAGLEKCSAIIQPAYHAIYALTGTTPRYLMKISNFIIYSNRSLSTDPSANPRGISTNASYSLPMFSDSIIAVTGNYGLVQPIVGSEVGSSPHVWERNTFHSFTANASLLLSAKGTIWPEYQTITLRDCIFSGPGTKPPVGTSHAGSYAENCSFVREGPDKITAKGDIDNEIGSIIHDPIYVNKTNPALATLFDVRSPLYGGKSFTGGNLAGGADYIGDAPPAICNVDPGSHDFGTFLVNDAPTTFTFIVGNIGVEPLYIYDTSINGSSDFTIDEKPSSPMDAGTTDTLVVRYTPLTQGAQSANVEIDCSIVGSPKLVPVNAVADVPTKVYDWMLIK